MSWKWLNQIWAQLQLLVEELKDCVGIELSLLIVGCLCSCQLSVSFCVTGMGGAAAGDCAWVVLGEGGWGGWDLGELRHELFEKKLSIVEAAVVRDVHGHPETHRGQLIMEKLKEKQVLCFCHKTPHLLYTHHVSGPWCCPWPYAAVPRCDGTKHCSCWDSGRQRRSTPSSPREASVSAARWASGSSANLPTPFHRGAAGSYRLLLRTAVRPAEAPSVCSDTTTTTLVLTCRATTSHFTSKQSIRQLLNTLQWEFYRWIHVSGLFGNLVRASFPT